MPTSKTDQLRVEGTPSPASRPRVTKFGTYYTKPYQEWMAACQQQIASQMTVKFNGSLWACAEIIVQKPKTTKLEAPRGDADNYAKAILDGATKAGLWGDDSQILLLVARKRFTEPGETAGANLYVGELQ